MMNSTAKTASSPSRRVMERPFLDHKMCRVSQGRYSVPTTRREGHGGRAFATGVVAAGLFLTSWLRSAISLVSPRWLGGQQARKGGTVPDTFARLNASGSPHSA